MQYLNLALALLAPLCQGSSHEPEVRPHQTWEVASHGKSIVRSAYSESSLPASMLVTRHGHSALAEIDAFAGDQTTPKKVNLGWAPCSWQTPSEDDMMTCGDGHRCDPAKEQWTCCATHRNRAVCPKDFPKMCNQKDCGGNDFCCAAWCELYDGDRTCPEKHYIYGITRGWLNMPTRTSDGTSIQEWSDLIAGSMTWELWYSRKTQTAANSAKGNAVMSTYADDHNSDSFSDPSLSNRRRNIGVYIQPATGQLSLAVFTGESAMKTPAAGDLYGGAKVMLGPTIADEDWHHIAVTWDKQAGQGILYLDGEMHPEAVPYEPGTDDPGMDGKLVIGGGHLGRTTTCQVSQFRIWKVALGVGNVKSIVGCGEPDLPSTDLRGFYRLNKDLTNSAGSSGLESNLKPEGPDGFSGTEAFEQGNPCVIGPPGLKGEDAMYGPTGPPGPAGKTPGPKGKDNSVAGEPGPQGINGTRGSPGNPAPPAAEMFTPATWRDFYSCSQVCAFSTLVVAILLYRQYIMEHSPQKAASGEEWAGEDEWQGGEY